MGSGAGGDLGSQLVRLGPTSLPRAGPLHVVVPQRANELPSELATRAEQEQRHRGGPRIVGARVQHHVDDEKAHNYDQGGAQREPGPERERHNARAEPPMLGLPGRHLAHRHPASAVVALRAGQDPDDLAEPGAQAPERTMPVIEAGRLDDGYGVAAAAAPAA